VADEPLVKAGDDFLGDAHVYQQRPAGTDAPHRLGIGCVYLYAVGSVGDLDVAFGRGPPIYGGDLRALLAHALGETLQTDIDDLQRPTE